MRYNVWKVNGWAGLRRLREDMVVLRALLGEPARKPEGPLYDTVAVIEEFIGLCRHRSGQVEASVRFRTFAVWAEGLRRSLVELDESLFAAGYFADRVRHAEWNTLSPEEKLDYDRHVYFDKNAYIRMFSVLDKLGTLLNDLLELKTERIKVHFSYFTVLRRMTESHRDPELVGRLTALKEAHRDPMSRLRNRRNMEIHSMNAELQDDLRQSLVSAGAVGAGRLEDLAGNLADSEQGWEMVRDTLAQSFRFACGLLRRMS
jgi:hypothetical protein